MAKKNKKDEKKNPLHRDYSLFSNVRFVMKRLCAVDKRVKLLIPLGIIAAPFMNYLWSFISKAVIDIINSQNEMALKSSMNQLQGSIKEKINGMRERIIYEIAFIESALDDPEHISVDGYGEWSAVNTRIVLSDILLCLNLFKNSPNQ